MLPTVPARLVLVAALLLGGVPYVLATPVARIGRNYWNAVARNMDQTLQRLSNYSCIAHTARYQSTRPTFTLKRIDDVRLQVSAIAGQESFSLPGGDRSVYDPRELIPGGLVSTGLFQGFAHEVFSSRALSELVFRGSDDSSGESLIRFQFRLHPEKAPLRVRVSGYEALVRGRGDFWVDQRTMRMRRMVVENISSVPHLRVQRLRYVMDWAPVLTAGGEMFLPQNVEVWMMSTEGMLLRNRITLAQCREYAAESSIRFDLDESQAAEIEAEPAPAGPRFRYLPDGLDLSVRLEDKLSLSSMKVGDEFRAVLTKAVRHKGQTLLPEGAPLMGRIRRLDTHQNPTPHAVAWLEIVSVLDAEGDFVFLAELRKRQGLPGLVDEVPGAQSKGLSRLSPGERFTDFDIVEPGYRSVPGVGSFVFLEGFPEIPAGYQMEWRTLPAR